MLKIQNLINNMMLNYTQSQINILDSNSGEVIYKKETTGFVNTDCEIVENILLGIMRFTVKEQNIFDTNAISNLNDLYNTIAYGSWRFCK